MFSITVGAQQWPLGTATVLLADAEKEIVLWINALRGAGVPLSAFMLHAKARKVAETHGFRLTQALCEKVRLFSVNLYKLRTDLQ